MKTMIKSTLAAVAMITLMASTSTHERPAAEGIQFFEGTWAEAIAESEKSGKPIFLDAYASWCGPCKLLKSRVFTNASVGEYYNEHFINVKMDMERGEGRQLARTFRITAYPTLIFVQDGKVIKKAVGYHNPEQLKALGASALQQGST